MMFASKTLRLDVIKPDGVEDVDIHGTVDHPTVPLRCERFECTLVYVQKGN